MIEQSDTIAEQERIGYGCSCGFTTPDISTQSKKDFTSHVMRSALRDGKGTHKSIGRVNLDTGEVVAPPWGVLDPEVKRDYFRQYHQNRTTHKGNGDKDQSSQRGKGGDSSGKGEKPQTTTILAQAQQIRVVPKIFTMDYSPILRAAQDAAVKFFGWRSDMPLENFIDTCLYLFFEEKGITLCGYVVHESLLKKEGKNDGS